MPASVATFPVFASVKLILMPLARVSMALFSPGAISLLAVIAPFVLAWYNK